MKFRLIFVAYVLFFSGINLVAQSNNILPIVPKPLHVTVSDNSILLDKEWTVYVDSKATIDKEYISSVLKELGIQTLFTDKKNSAQLILNIDKKISKNPEAYQLVVSDKKGVTASASGGNGLLYAIQTLRQIVSSKDDKVSKIGRASCRERV